MKRDKKSHKRGIGNFNNGKNGGVGIIKLGAVMGSLTSSMDGLNESSPDRLGRSKSIRN